MLPSRMEILYPQEVPLLNIDVKIDINMRSGKCWKNRPNAEGNESWPFPCERFCRTAELLV